MSYSERDIARLLYGKLLDMGKIGYNTGVNHIKSDGLLAQHRHPFSSRIRGADTMTDHTPFFPENLEDYTPWVATYGLLQPYGKCQCGCGNDAPVATITRPHRGVVKGYPTRFLHGHSGTKRYWMGNPNPSGLCMCGCGYPAPIAAATASSTGLVQGLPARFIEGHRKHPGGNTAEERFWFFCVVGDADSCWGWNGSRHAFGYGFFVFRYEQLPAHRFSYELHNGPIPEGEGYHGTCVLHKCDNPSCCNPKHLFLGTAGDNVEDMVSKRRHAFGEKNGNSKITEADVLEIRRLGSMGMNALDIAKRYGLVEEYIRQIQKGANWSHVHGEAES